MSIYMSVCMYKHVYVCNIFHSPLLLTTCGKLRWFSCRIISMSCVDLPIYISMYVCMYVWVYIHIHMSIRMYEHMYIWVYVCMSICLYEYMYVWVYHICTRGHLCIYVWAPYATDSQTYSIHRIVQQNYSCI